ncbi:DUF4040 family protein [Micrococcus terreus]|uniref:DUF4040 family protein n=1 Tax=Micrococcus terreus TaxID=574650 RepID=UPI003D75BE11
MSTALTLTLLAVGLVLTPVLCRLLGRNAGWPLAVVYLGAAALYWPALSAGPGTDAADVSVPWVTLGELTVHASFSADPIASVFTLIALLIGAVVLIYSTRYLEPGPNLSFYLGMALFTLAMVGLVTADDLIVLFLCWELTSLASFLLIARSGQGAFAPSMRTLLITFVGGLALLAAVALIAVRTGTTSIREALASEVWTQDPGLLTLVGVLVAVAAMTKSAQFPFHSWLPDAMAAATPVSAYLHAAAVVKAGIFLLLRFSPVFHGDTAWQVLLVTAGLVTSAVGGWRALQQTDLKKLMAYSTVSQLGLIVAAIGTGTEAGIAAALIHTIAHAMFKSGLFMMVGVVDHATGTRDLRRMPALARALPFSFAVTVLGAGAMAGIPPLLGFVSKESIFTALNEWGGTLPLLGAALGSVLTFAYCAKIVVGGFLDPARRTPDDQGTSLPDDATHLHAPGPVLVGMAGLPILVSVAAVFVLPLFDTVVGTATGAALPATDPHPHFVLWHGITPELLTTLAVFALGAVTIATRRRLWPALEQRTLPFSGASILESITTGAERAGRGVARLTASDAAGPHAGMMVGSLAVVVLAGVATLVATDALAPQTPGLTQPIDVVLLVLIAASVIGVCVARSRLGATVALSAVGILMTVQILSLGAPDVALTQLLVESLTVIVIMLVLQRLPRTFERVKVRKAAPAIAISLAAGLAMGLATWALTSRRGKSEVGQYLVDNGQDITGGDNIVNVILVEFRALDTLGELAVLGMTGVAIAAVLSTVRSSQLEPTRVANARSTAQTRTDMESLPQLGSATARRAILSSWGNAAQLQLMLKVLMPILAVISALLFWRGHNEPGGGFIAALVGSAIVGLLYLSTSQDRQIGPPRAPIYLIGGGVIVAVATGLVNMVFTGTYMEPQHGYMLGVHLSSSLVFDLGVYLAVIGLLLLTFNVLGTSLPREHDQDADPTAHPEHPRPTAYEGMRERVDESVHGEVDGPLDTVRGEEPRPIRAGTRHIESGRQPSEWGRS